MLVAQSCLTLCHPIDCSPLGPSVHGILQARTPEWVAISFSKGNYRKKESEVAQSCPTLCHPMDCSLPSSSIHGIFQATVLEWDAIAFSHIIQQCINKLGSVGSMFGMGSDADFAGELTFELRSERGAEGS